MSNYWGYAYTLISCVKWSCWHLSNWHMNWPVCRRKRSIQCVNSSGPVVKRSVLFRIFCLLMAMEMKNPIYLIKFNRSGDFFIFTVSRLAYLRPVWTINASNRLSNPITGAGGYNQPTSHHHIINFCRFHLIFNRKHFQLPRAQPTFIMKLNFKIIIGWQIELIISMK